MIALERPVLGLGYAFWLRGRTALFAACLLVFALAVAARIPAFRNPFGGNVALPPIVFAVPVVLLPIGALLNVFTFGPIDVSAKGSPFPMHVRLLPMSTPALVGWPMLFGVVTLGTLWLALLGLVLRPLGLTTSIVWPTTIVIATTAWVQAAAWVPLPYRFLRVPFFLGAVGVPFCLATIDPRTGDHFWSIEAGMLAWAASAYALATLGLRRARTGVASFRDVAASASDVQPAAPPFASVFAARRWFERRRTLGFIGKAFAVAPLPFVAMCVLAVRFPHSVFGYRMGGMPLACTWAEIYLVVVPLLASSALGGFIGRFDHARKPGVASFFALQPVSTARFVADKLVTAGIAAAILFASSVVVAGFAFWAYAAHAPPHVEVLVARFVDHGLPAAALGAIAFGLLLWRNLTVDLWTTMTGRVWPSRIVAGIAALSVALLPVSAAWLASHRGVLDVVVTALPYVAGTILLAKLVAAAVIGRKLRRLVSRRVLFLGGASWCAAVALFLAVTSHFTNVSWTLVCLVAVLVPLARIGLAPLALDRSRHA